MSAPPTPPEPGYRYPAALAAALALGLAFGIFVSLFSRVWIGVLVGALLMLAVFVALTHRSRRRRRLARLPFPASMRTGLLENVEFYRRLPEPDKARFEREILFFLDEHVVTGPRGAPLSERLRVLVAASAVIVVFGRPDFRYPRLRDIVVYGEAFDEEYREGRAKHILGMVHGQGPILFSARALEYGFSNPRDGLHVGLHEFAHVLDFETGSTDGVPSLMPWRSITPWLAVMHEELMRAKSNRTILRQYATTNEAEFFAVATEAFFERPRALRQKHAALYSLLRETYGQDPAETEERNG